MVHINVNNELIEIRDQSGELTGRHFSQLAFWGFERDLHAGTFRSRVPDVGNALGKLSSYLSRSGIPYSLDECATALLESAKLSRSELQSAIDAGARLKSGSIETGAKDFLEFQDSALKRPLKSHQIKAALHLIAVGSAANFSVPGSGKTSVILSVFEWRRRRGELDSLFVVGPSSCFLPWQVEYEQVLGEAPRCEILAGGDVRQRRSKYYVGKDRLADLYLTSFQTLSNDWPKVKLLFNQPNVRFAFVVDEAHYIKQLEGTWATAILQVARYAKMRCVLTGTPFPHSYIDSFNCFDVLWPAVSPISDSDRVKLRSYVQQADLNNAKDLLNSRIGGLFYRVRKNDLGLAPQDIRAPIQVRMNKHERRVYESISAKVKSLASKDSPRDIELLLRLRQGRMMRLRQSLSYVSLLANSITEYDEHLVEDDASLYETITHYDELERPRKLEVLTDLVNDLRASGEKAVIWSNFIGTLQLITRHLKGVGHKVDLIFGGTPSEHTNIDDERTRERIIARFLKRSGGISILVANPAACAESISLHKACANSIYYDLSYNCAQYLQSMDRIHRVGGSEEKTAHYHFLQYADTMEPDILDNLHRKSRNMSMIIDEEYPIYSMDMFAGDEEAAAYERLFKKRARSSSKG